MKTNIFKCPRCKEDHKNLEIKPLTNPIETPDCNGNKINYWVMCPKLNEPILVTVLE